MATLTISRKRGAMPWFFPVLACMALLLYGCPSVQINVGRGDEGTFSHPGLQQCPGTEFEITVKQNGKSVTTTGVVVAGQATFKSRDLRDIDFSGIVSLELRVVNIPNNPGTVECQFERNRTYTTGAVVLRKLAENLYAIDVDKFK